MLKRRWLFFLFLAMSIVQTGCGGGYVIQGKAIRGEFTSLSFVRPSDTRLNSEGVASVEITLYRNPDTLGRAIVARSVTDDQGNIFMPVDVFGVGWTIEQWMIFTYRPGMQSASTFVHLPDKKKNMLLLITLGPGVAERAPQTDEAWQQYEKFK